MSEIFAILSGFKIAIFLCVFVLSILINKVAGKRKMYGLIIMAVSFVLVAILEFFSVLAGAYPEMSPWFAERENVDMIIYPLFLVAGLGILWYFAEINRNIKDYR